MGVVARGGADYAAKYVGTWTSKCLESNQITDAATNALTYNEISVVFARVSDTELKVTRTVNIFASTDTTCTGTALGRIAYTGDGSGNFSQGAAGIQSSAGGKLLIDAQTTADGKIVDKVTIIEEALAASLGNNATLTAGTVGHQFKINTRAFQANTQKSLLYVDSGKIYIGNSKELADTDYPTTLYLDEVFLTKQ